MDSSNGVHFGMKKLALHNWREPDVPKFFPGLTEEVWLREAMNPQLIAAVPEVMLVGQIHQQDGLLAMVTHRDDQPREIIADYPVDRCVCIGMHITYTEDRSVIYVDWPPGYNKTHDWPVVFAKE